MNSRIALGTAQFGLNYGIANQNGVVAPNEVSKIIATGAGSGMRTLDTAIAYDSSESVLGSCNISGWEIVTKLPAIPKDCVNVQAWALKQIEESLSRLNVDATHGVLLHHPDQLFSADGSELLKALQLMQKWGYTKKIGVSVYDPKELNDILEMHAFELVQAPLNILDRRLVDSGWAHSLRTNGVELHTRSAFLQGLLLMPTGHRPTKFHRWSHIWDEWQRWLAVNDLAPVQACMRYVLSVHEVDRLIVGVDSLAQLQDILSAATGTVPDLPKWQSTPEVELINPALWSQL